VKRALALLEFLKGRKAPKRISLGLSKKGPGRQSLSLESGWGRFSRRRRQLGERVLEDETSSVARKK